MKSVPCEVCKRRVELSVELLVAAMVGGTFARCTCGSQIEAVYIDHKLVTANVPRLIQFSAPLQITDATALEAR